MAMGHLGVLMRIHGWVAILPNHGAIAVPIVFILLTIWDRDTPFGPGAFSSGETSNPPALEAAACGRSCHPHHLEGTGWPATLRQHGVPPLAQWPDAAAS